MLCLFHFYFLAFSPTRPRIRAGVKIKIKGREKAPEGYPAAARPCNVLVPVFPFHVFVLLAVNDDDWDSGRSDPPDIVIAIFPTGTEPAKTSPHWSDGPDRHPRINTLRYLTCTASKSIRYRTRDGFLFSERDILHFLKALNRER